MILQNTLIAFSVITEKDTRKGTTAG